MPLKFELASLDSLLARGLEELVFEDWEEVEAHPDAIPLSIDWDHYRKIEAVGTYRIVAAWDGDVLAGYNSFFVNRHTRAKDTIQAVSDALYLAPQYRKGANGWMFLKATDDALDGLGVRLIYYEVKLKVRLGQSKGTLGDILFRLGYNHTGQVFTKVV